MRRGESGQRSETNYVGKSCFKWRVLGLHLLDLDKMLGKHALGDDEGSCVRPMSIITIGVEILRAARPPALRAAFRDLSRE